MRCDGDSDPWRHGCSCHPRRTAPRRAPDRTAPAPSRSTRWARHCFCFFFRLIRIDRTEFCTAYRQRKTPHGSYVCVAKRTPGGGEPVCAVHQALPVPDRVVDPMHARSTPPLLNQSDRQRCRRHTFRLPYCLQHLQPARPLRRRDDRPARPRGPRCGHPTVADSECRVRSLCHRLGVYPRVCPSADRAFRRGVRGRDRPPSVPRVRRCAALHGSRAGRPH